MTTSRGSEEVIGFVGLGAMGSPVASRVVGAGFNVLLYDIESERVISLASATGAQVVRRITDLSNSDIVVCLLPDSSAVEAVLLGEEGLLSVLKHGSLIIDMGSSDPNRTVQLARRAEAVGAGMADAPVSGGVARAIIGDLTVMFGGTDTQLTVARPVLESIGSKVLKVGEVGAGHAMKALNNWLSAIGLMGSLEILEVGKRFGLLPQTIVEVLNSSSGRNNSTETKLAQFVLDGSFNSGFSLRLMLKDIGIAQQLAKDCDFATPVGDICAQMWQSASEELPADADHTMVALCLGKKAVV